MKQKCFIMFLLVLEFACRHRMKTAQHIYLIFILSQAVSRGSEVPPQHFVSALSNLLAKGQNFIWDVIPG